MIASSYRAGVSAAIFVALALSLATSLGGMELFSVLSVLWGIVVFLHFRPVFIDQRSGRYCLTVTLSAVAFSVLCIAPLLADSVPAIFVIDALRQSRWLIYCICVSLLASQLGAHARALTQWPVILGLFVAGAVGLIQATCGEALAESGSWLIPEDIHYRGSVVRATGFFNLPQAFSGVVGMLALSLLPYALGMNGNLSGGSRLRSAFALMATVVGFLCVVASGTRGAYVALLCSVIVTVLIMMWAHLMQKQWGLMFSGLTGAVLLGLLLIGYESLDLVSVSTVTMDVSYQVRESLTRAYFAMVNERPLLGSGLGYSASLLPEYYQKIGGADAHFVGHAHSNYLQALVDGGIAALTCYLVLIISFLLWNLSLFQSSNDQSQQCFLLGLLAAQLYFHIFGLLECNFIDLKVNHTLIFVWGLIIGMGGLKPRHYEREDLVVSGRSR